MIDMPKTANARTDRRAEVALADLTNRAIPRILPMLDEARLPDTIIEHLRHWIDGILSAEAAALSLEALDQAGRALSCLYLSCHVYKGVPRPEPGLRGQTVDIEFLPRADADGARIGQARVLELMLLLHGSEGARRAAAVQAFERENLERLSQMIASHTR